MAELVRCGADTDAMEARSGRTALHFAVERHDMEVVKYLLQVMIVASAGYVTCFKNE